MSVKHTKDRLADELKKIGLDGMAALASLGKYDDYLSDSATNIMDLVNELAEVAKQKPELRDPIMELRKRAMEGEFDATREESDAWAASPEGQAAFRGLIKGD